MAERFAGTISGVRTVCACRSKLAKCQRIFGDFAITPDYQDFRLDWALFIL
jgi:hypothetical protein